MLGWTPGSIGNSLNILEQAEAKKKKGKKELSTVDICRVVSHGPFYSRTRSLVSLIINCVWLSLSAGLQTTKKIRFQQPWQHKCKTLHCEVVLQQEKKRDYSETTLNLCQDDCKPIEIRKLVTGGVASGHRQHDSASDEGNFLTWQHSGRGTVSFDLSSVTQSHHKEKLEFHCIPMKLNKVFFAFIITHHQHRGEANTVRNAKVSLRANI